MALSLIPLQISLYSLVHVHCLGLSATLRYTPSVSVLMFPFALFNQYFIMPI